MKIKVEGQETFIEGQFVTEDERYIYLHGHFGKTRVPHARVLYIVDEDVSLPVSNTVSEAPKPFVTSAKLPPSPHEQPPLVNNLATELQNRKKNKVQDAMEALSRKIRGQDYIMKAEPTALSNLSQIDPVENTSTYEPDDRVVVDVVFEGDKVGGFKLDLPRELMGGRYTPALGREIFAFSEVTKFMEGSMLNGVPEITENTVKYTTVVNSVENSMNLQDKLKLAGAAISASTSFSQESTTPRPTSFSMTASPFDELPKLTLQEGEDEGS